MDLHFLISNFSYIAIFILMTTNGVVNFPSSQFLYLICGYFISTGSLLFIPTIIAGALGNTLGNCITFLLIRKYDRPLARKILLLDEETFTKLHTALHTTFSKRGMWYIFFGKLIPSVKAFIPILAGLANTKFYLTSFLFLVASSIWATLLVSIGYYFGENVSLASASGVSFLIGVTVMYILYKKISTKI